MNQTRAGGNVEGIVSSIYSPMLDQWLGVDLTEIMGGSFEQIHPYREPIGERVWADDRRDQRCQWGEGQRLVRGPAAGRLCPMSRRSGDAPDLQPDRPRDRQGGTNLLTGPGFLRHWRSTAS